MTKEELIKELEIMPAAIFCKAEELIEKEDALARAKKALRDKEASLLLNGTINGKNEEIRKAQLYLATSEEHAQVNKAEIELERARAELTFQRDRLRALVAIASIFKTETDEACESNGF